MVDGGFQLGSLLPNDSQPDYVRFPADAAPADDVPVDRTKSASKAGVRKILSMLLADKIHRVWIHANA